MKTLKTAIVSCALITSVISTPARAVGGSALAVPGAVIGGVAIIAVSIGGAYGSYRLIKTGKTALGIVAGLFSAGGAFVGWALLDGENGGQFSELSAEGAKEVGVSESDREIYNSEVEQVNAIALEIASELEKRNSDSQELARDMWIDYGTQLAPETMKTVIAIAQQNI